jgi:hypothetical protein
MAYHRALTLFINNGIDGFQVGCSTSFYTPHDAMPQDALVEGRRPISSSLILPRA